MGRVKLTDAQRKKIIADYVQCQNYSEVARQHSISRETVRGIIAKDESCCEKLQQKQYENIQSILGLSKAQLSANIKAFCDRVKANGYNAVHYTNTNHVLSFINLSEIPYPVWQAHYVKTAPNPGKPPFSSPNVYAWQYSSTGSVPGNQGKR